MLFLSLVLEFSSFQDGFVSVSHSHSDCLVRLNFLKLDVSSLFCYLLCELIGSAFAKFCVHEWSEQAVQSRPVEPVLLQYQ